MKAPWTHSKHKALLGAAMSCLAASTAAAGHVPAAAVAPPATLARDPSPGPSGRERAKACYQAGRRAKDEATKRRFFLDGAAEARAILAQDHDDPAGLLWLAANLGAEALVRGKFAALKVLPDMERMLLRLDLVAPTFEYAAGARTLARLYHKAPALISIGSSSKARSYFEKALKLAGDFPGTQAFAAEFFADEGDGNRARALAQACLRSPLLATEPDGAEWRQIAETVLADLGP